MTDKIAYTLATHADIPTMIDYRIDFLTELVGQPAIEDLVLLRKNLEVYFMRTIASKEYLCFLAKAGGKTIGIGGMTIREQPGSFRNPSGRTGYIMNMYTLPGYRKQGICSGILEQLSDLANEMGISVLELHATKAGEPVYQKFGFEIHKEPTYKKFSIA